MVIAGDDMALLRKQRASCDFARQYGAECLAVESFFYVPKTRWVRSVKSL